MPNPLTGARGRAILVSAAALLAGGAVAGCDLQENADLERGRTLFVENCGTCHALTEARTAATIGPDLDSSFAAARDVGMDQDTIEGVVQSQIQNPREVNEASPQYDRVFMPADLVTGRDAEDVAAYVASVAGVPGIEPPELGDGEQIFTDLCAQCHTLAAANSTATVGPVLDDVLPDRTAAEIEESIRDPEAELSPGFGSGMPPFDATQLPDENLQDLIDYLIESVGGGGGNGGGG